MSEPRPRPAWARSFTFDELPAEYKSRFDRAARHVEPERGPGPYARDVTDMITDFLERLNYRPNATAARNEAALDHFSSPELQVGRVIDLRLQAAWRWLRGPYRETIAKVEEELDREFVARKSAETPSGKLAREFAERLGEAP